jgi:hypothetical protein
MFEKLLKGQQISLGMYRHYGLSRLKDSETYILKINQGHLLMHWLVKNFDVSAVLLLRHPCAVVASQLKMDFFSSIELKIDKGFPDFRYNTVYKRYEHIYRKIRTIEAYLAFIWAIKVKSSIYHPDNNRRWITVAYESLLHDFENQISRIFSYLGHTLPDKIIKMKTIPSKSTHPHSITSIEKGNQIDSWRSELNTNQISEILHIIDQFEIDIYNDSDEPDYDKIYKSYSNL